MFLPIFSSNESFCADPVTATALITAAIITAGGPVAVAIIDHTSAAISRIANRLVPTAEQAKINAEHQEKLDYFNEKTKYQNCLATSKPDSAITTHGVPVGCQDIMMAFVLCGGNAKQDVAEMTATFHEFKQR